MKKWFKGFLSLVLALVLVFGLMPSSTLAANDTSTGGREGEDNSGGQYYVEWVPYVDENNHFAGIQMHLKRLKDGYEVFGPDCRYVKDGRRIIYSEYASFSVMTPEVKGNSLDWWLTEAEQMGYNGDVRRGHLDFTDGWNDCYAKWNQNFPPDAYEGEWAIFINLTKKPQGTWGYFVDTDGGGGLNGDVDTYEFGIKPGETRTLPDGFWQANWQKRGDWTGWGDYTECGDVGPTMWPAKTTDGTPITRDRILTGGTGFIVNDYITDILSSSDVPYGGEYHIGFKKADPGTWGYWIDENKNGIFEEGERHDIGHKSDEPAISLPDGKFRVVKVFRDNVWIDYGQSPDYSEEFLTNQQTTAMAYPFKYPSGTSIETDQMMSGGDQLQPSKCVNELLKNPFCFGGKIYIGLVPSDDKFTVTYDLAGGKAPEDCSHNFEDQTTTVDFVNFSTITAYEEEPVKIVDGVEYKFKGWKVQNDFDSGESPNYFKGQDIKPKDELKSKNAGILHLKAEWEDNRFRVTYDLDGGLGDNTTQEVPVDGEHWSEITTHKAPTKTNEDGEELKFRGWMVMQDFFAGYEDVEIEEEEHEEGAERSAEEELEEKAADAPSVEYKVGDVINAEDIVKSKLPGELPLKALWSDKFRVEYDLNGGTGDDSPQEAEVKDGEWVSFEAHKAPTMTVPGNTVYFLGWEIQNTFNAGEGLVYKLNDLIQAEAEIRSKNPGVLYLKAKWNIVPTPNNGSPIEYWGDGASEGEVEPETIPEDLKYYDNIVPLGHEDDMIERLQEQVIDLKQDYGRGYLFDRILRSYEYNNLGTGDTGTPDSYDEQESKFKGWLWEGSSDTTPRSHLKDWTSMAWTGYETYYVERLKEVDRTRTYCHHGCSVSYANQIIVYEPHRVRVTYLPGTQGWINHTFFDETKLEKIEAQMKVKADQIAEIDRTIAYGDLNIPSCGCYTVCGWYSCWHVHSHHMGSYYSNRSLHLSQRSQLVAELNKLKAEREALMQQWNGKVLKFRARWEADYDTTDFAEENGSLARKKVGNDRPSFMEGSGTNLGDNRSDYHQMGWYDSPTNGNRITGNDVSLTLGEGKRFELENNGTYTSALPTARTKRRDDNTLLEKPTEAGKAVPVKGNPNDPYLWYAHWYSITTYDTTSGLKNLFNGLYSRTTKLYKDGSSYVTVTMTDPNIAGFTKVNITMNDGKDKGYIGDAKKDFIEIVYQNDTMEKNVTRYPTIYYDGTDVSNSIIFLGWNTKVDGTGNWYGSSLPDGSKGTPVGRGDGQFTLAGPDVTLYAVYKLDFNLIYDRNDQHDEVAYTMSGQNQTDRIADNMFTVNSTDVIKFRTNDDHKKDDELGADYTNFLMLGYNPNYWDDNLKEIKKKYRPYSHQGWSLDNKAYFQDNKVYHCMNPLRTNVNSLMQVNPDQKSDIDVANIRDYLAECFTWNPLNNIEFGPNATFSVRTYAVWDQYPDIWAYDVTYTKQLVDKYLDAGNLEGFIELVFYDCLHDETDKEDDPRGYIDKVEIGGVTEADLRVDDYGSTTAEVKVTDTAGNVTVYPIRIYIFSDQFGTSKENIDETPDVDDPSTPQVEHYYDDSRYQMKVFSRFIDELNYNKMNGDKPATEDGALMEYSKWYTNKERAEQIQRAFERMKSGTYSGFKSSYVYTISDLQHIQELVKKNGIGKTSRPDLWDETKKWLFAAERTAKEDIESKNNNTIGFRLNKEWQLQKLQQNNIYELGE